MDVVQEAWRAKVKGNEMYVLMQKLRIVKGALTQWNKDRIGNVVDKVSTG